MESMYFLYLVKAISHCIGIWNRFWKVGSGLLEIRVYSSKIPEFSQQHSSALFFFKKMADLKVIIKYF